MYAIIEHGSHQYKATEQAVLRLDKIDAEPGEKISFDKVLAVRGDEDIQVGSPYVEGASVTGTVVQQGRGRKISIIKYKRKKRYRRQAGHRQHFTAVRIDDIAV
jgi:large subunit ribosomal protein L21